MEWPYTDHAAPPSAGRTSTRSTPPSTASSTGRTGYARQMQKYKKVMAYSGNHFTRNWIADEKQHPITGTPYAWVRARVLGGKTNFWGRVSLRFSELRPEGDEPRRLRRGLADRLRRHLAVLRQGRHAARHLGHARRTSRSCPTASSSAPLKLNCGEVQLQSAIAKMGRHLIPGRAGVTTDGVANKYRARCMGRGRCGRGCDCNAAFHSPTALIFPARDTGNLTVRPDSVVSEVLLDDEHQQGDGRPRHRQRTRKRGDGLQGDGS